MCIESHNHEHSRSLSQMLLLCLTLDLGNGKELITEGQTQCVRSTVPTDFLNGGKMCKSCAFIAQFKLQ